MAEPSLEIADHLATQINAMSGITATRVNIPLVRKEELANSGFTVQVTPMSFESPELDRNSELQHYVTAVAGYQKAATKALQDAAMEHMDDVRRKLSSLGLQSLSISGDGWSGASLILPLVSEPIFDPMRLREEHIFQSVVMVTYGIYRNRSS